MDELQRLSYKDVKGSGIAALCPTIEMPQDVKSLKPGSYEMVNFCIEPTKFEVRVPSHFVRFRYDCHAYHLYFQPL